MAEVSGAHGRHKNSLEDIMGRIRWEKRRGRPRRRLKTPETNK